MCCDGKKSPLARDGRITARLPGGSFQVNVPGVGSVVARDRTGQANRGQVTTVVQVKGGGWRIV